MPAIGQIYFNFTSLEEIQNTENLNGTSTPPQREEAAISPLTLAQYANYNRDLEAENFGTETYEWLAYKGGYITAGDRLNVKQSWLTITQNLTVRNNTRFKKNIDLVFNHIVNIKRQGDINLAPLDFVNKVYLNTGSDYSEDDAMTVGDFREYCHTKNMIMAWSGSYSDLVNNLPYWRLCAPPDSGVTVNGVTVPNLEGYFILAGGYSDAPSEGTINTYIPTDNLGRSMEGTISLSIGKTGGYNAITLSISEMFTHNHEVLFNVAGGTVVPFTEPATNPPLTFITGRGNVKTSSTSLRVRCVKDTKWSCKCNGDCKACACWAGIIPYPCCCGSCHSDLECGSTTVGTVNSLTSVTVGELTTGSVSIADNSVSGSISNQTVRGNNEAHENRPPFYVLGYIIYVGALR
jgi:microcystin-dependent protein